MHMMLRASLCASLSMLIAHAGEACGAGVRNFALLV